MAARVLLLIAFCLVMSVHSQLPTLESILNAPNLLQAGETPSLGGADPQTVLTQGLMTASDFINNMRATIAGGNRGGNTGDSLNNLFLPQSNDIMSLTDQPGNTNPTSCFLEVVESFQNISDGGTTDYRTCGLVVALEATKYEKKLNEVRDQLSGISQEVSTKTWNCVTKSATSTNPMNGANCISAVMNEHRDFINSTVASVEKMITETRQIMDEMPECATMIMEVVTTNSNGVLDKIVRCASNSGVAVKLPTFPGAPDFNAILNSGMKRLNKPISELTNSANSIGKVFGIVNKAITSVNDNTPVAMSVAIIQAMTPSVKKIHQKVVETMRSGYKNDRICTATAQEEVGGILNAAVTKTIKCTNTIALKSDDLKQRLTKLTKVISDKTFSSLTTVLGECSKTTTVFNSLSIVRCYRLLETQFNNFISLMSGQSKEIFDVAQILSKEPNNCLDTYKEEAAKAAVGVVSKMNECIDDDFIRLPDFSNFFKV